ncbi:hypothetical protein QL285_026153 [Trifolium repens]|nr:hypothetical protein QL285_026153 [Trifolium repens]
MISILFFPSSSFCCIFFSTVFLGFSNSQAAGRCRPPSPFMCSKHSGELFICWYAVTRELCTNLRVPIRKRIANRYGRIGTRFASFTANSVTMLQTDQNL